MNLVRIATWAEVPDRVPTAAAVEGIDLVIIRRDEEHSVLYGRCLHRGALLADGEIHGDDLICGLHGWDYRIETGVSAYNNVEVLEKFASVVEGDGLFVDLDDVIRWKLQHPQPYSPDVYQGLYKDPHGVPEEPYVMRIHELAANGLEKIGMHGFVAAMGVPRQDLPSWDNIQFVTAQLARLPLLDDVPVGTEVCIGNNAAKPLWLDRAPLRLRHVVRRALAGGEDRTRAGRAARRNRHLFGRRRHAPRGTGRELSLLLRARVGALRLELGRAHQSAGVPFQTRPGRQDRHRRTPARPEGEGSYCRGARSPGRDARGVARDVPGLARRRRLPALRGRGPRPEWRYPDRREALRPTHRSRHRRRARDRRRLHHSRRPRRRDRARRRCCSATTSRSRRSRRWRALVAISIGVVGATSRSS